MRKLIFVNRYFAPDHSATSQMLTDLAFYLAENGYSVTVVTSRQLYDQPGAQLPRRETLNCVHVQRAWSTSFGRGSLIGRAADYLSFYLGAAIELLAATHRGDVIIAKTDPPLISFIAWLVARLRGARLVNWVQDLFPEVAEELHISGIRILSPLLRWLRNISLRGACATVVLGNLMATRVVSQGIKKQRVHVIHNWSDGAAIQPIDRASNRLRQEWNLRDQFVVGYSGNMGRAHDFETLINAADLLKNNDRITFLFIGGGAQRARLEEACRARGIRNVLFKPYQPREALAESLGAADVHIVSLMPDMEGLIVPSKFYGIAAAGRPTVNIGDHEGEVAQIIRDAKCGHTIAPGDSTNLASLLEKLAADAAGLLLLGGSARTTFEQRFDKSIALGTWQSVLEQCT